MGKREDVSKKPPSTLRRWLYRSRLINFLPIDRKKQFYLLTVFLVGVILFGLLNWRKSDASSESVTAGKSDRDRATKLPALRTGNTRLFYNRVPKCGSSTLVALLKKLAERNGFQHHSSPKLDDWGMFIKEQREDFVKEFNDEPPRTSFDRHLFFLDFAEFREKNPIYINLIRDPTERFISEFYFRRRLQNEGVKKGERKWYDEDLENCVRTGKDYDCRLIDGTFIKNMIAFFCGHDIECSKHNSPNALSRAKQNVEKHFAVVGILEDLDMSLQVLEQTLPAYFAGAVDLYASNPDHVVNKGKNRVDRVSEEVKQIIRANLTAEYDFYDFVRKRLIAQSQGKL
ncbi:putative Heparan sulfate 2-O-sulfotransferase pipe [Hypsibius exemplaris]|uniref:Heparan sulfate 2-O-sulfotransferase pipe n=1 Tax=Hypsibius exemplaris TaxID=2072580 RepID=A0A1W0XC27_HYPEX|nr:putative Heparan sulfate 2-O-sulfotransferase pipe [Hypsibius exemplaris]